VPRISEQTVRAVRGRVQLTHRGRWTGRCPFHDENTPSFSLIPPDNSRYYCFGCGATGDAITWMIEQEGVGGFADAVLALAERFGVEIEYDDDSPAARAERAAATARRELLARAAAFFEESLWRAEEGEAAREYLRERGFGEDLLRRYRIGWAPAAGNALTRRAVSAGYRRADLEAAGLSRSGGGDFFVGRITFPISDPRGEVKGFGARTLDPNERAKYVNSPEGPHFKKREQVFGLDVVRAEAAKRGFVVVTEGYTDVFGVALAEAGPAVACMGTALTPGQLRKLAAVADEVALCFDSDAAGERAAWRTVEAATEVRRLRLMAVALPQGSDPGDLASDEDGRRALRDAVEGRETLVPSLIRMRARRADSAAEREQALSEITDLLRRVPDSVDKDEAVRLTGSLLGLSRVLEERLWSESREGGGERARAESRPATWNRRETRLIGLALAFPDAARNLLADMVPGTITAPGHARALALALEGVPPDEWPEEIAAVAAAALAEAGLPGAEDAELRELAYRLQIEALDRRVGELRAAGDESALLRVIDLRHQMRDALRETP
jgi:DNA primase